MHLDSTISGLLFPALILLFYGFIAWLNFKSHSLSSPKKGQIRPVSETLALGRFYMECFVSSVLIMASLYVIMIKPGSEDTQKWATGILGLVVGYWLKSSGSSTTIVKDDKEEE